MVTNTVAVIIIIAATIFMIMTTNVQLIVFTQVSTTTIAPIENAITSMLLLRYDDETGQGLTQLEKELAIINWGI